MSLSKKNLVKLNTFFKKNNLVNKNSSINSEKSENPTKFDDPIKNFYSIIDNSQNINETSEPNPLLINSEESLHNINVRKINYSENLSLEDQLYDEFNYLLDE